MSKMVCSSDLLGTFSYDSDEFEVVIGSRRIYLHYVGRETNGAFIKVPAGLRSAYKLFYRTVLRSPPLIPYGIVDCSSCWSRLYCQAV